MTHAKQIGSTADSILAGKVVAIIRLKSAEGIDYLIDGLVEGGIKAIEVTLNTPNAEDVIRRSRARLDKSIFFGAGTVMTLADLEMVADAGAQFIVTPNFDPAVIKRSLERGLPIFPGGLTPTEIAGAVQAGAPAVKVFPASLGGPEYFKLILGPLAGAKLIAVGGVSIDDSRKYIDSGAAAIGLGSLLIKNEDKGQTGFEAVKNRAIAVVQALKV
jgi:2-dehydro-3-deoxyphosphogluconate aldolase/(4S)-4-hydroxy-2-oxoglutarate aldolase